MSRIDELNNAIDTIKEECKSSKTCRECQLRGAGRGFVFCKMRVEPPCNWKHIEEQKNE